MAGDLSFEVVYTEHAVYVRRVLQRLGIQPCDLDDVTQDTFVAVHRQLPGFEGRAALETWLHAICWRVAAGYHRRAHIRREIVDATEELGAMPAGAFGDRPDRAQLLAALALLAPDDSDLLALYEVGGLSILELSELTGLARATIRRRLDATRSRLERQLALVRISKGPIVEPAATRAPPAAEPRGPAVVEHATPDYCITRLHDLVFARWRGNSRVPGLEVLSDVMLRAADETPEGITYLSVVEATAGPPDGPARAAHRTLAAKLNTRLRVAVGTTESKALFRLLAPILNACVFLSGAPIKMRFFSDERLAFDYVSQHSAVTPATLRQQSERMRRRIDAEELRAATSALGRAPSGEIQGRDSFGQVLITRMTRK